MLKEILNKEKEEKTEPQPYFYAGDASQCARKVYFNFKVPEKAEPFEPRTHRIFANGDTVHKRLCEELRKNRAIIAEEVGIAVKSPEIHGRMDAIIVDDEREFKILEIKSINGFGFKLMEEGKEGAKEEHIAQAQMYMWMTHQEGSPLKPISKAIILYENKDGQHLKEFEIFLDYEKIDLYLKKFRLIEKHLEERKPPKREYKRSDWQCRYCKYKKHCWGNKNEKD